MGNQESQGVENQLASQLLSRGVSYQQLRRHFPNANLEQFNYRQAEQIPNSKINEIYQKYNEQYYNITKRISKKSQKINFFNNNNEINELLHKKRNYKLKSIPYKEDPQHYFIPNEYSLIENIETEAYNMNISENGDKLLITSRQGLNIYTIKDNSDKFQFDQQVFPGTIQWTITDSDLSRDGNYLIHSTLNSYISMYSIDRKSYVNNFNVSEHPEDEDSWETSTRCFSVKFNSDGTNFIASTGGSNFNKAQLKVYDINHQYLAKSIPAHDDDINSITYLQKANPNIIVSASDDSTIKIWDTRALGTNNRPQGYLLGHACGITKISSREDGFYLASNSKDQSLKVWDIRKSTDSMDKPTQKSQFQYDYRGYCLSKKSVEKIKQLPQNQHFDNSVMTFYGHKVFRTLIRCHFSPNQVNGGRFVYTGSGDGKIFIFDILEQKEVAVLDSDTGGEILRDLVWHPSQYKLYAAGWDGNLVQWKFNPEYQNKEQPEQPEQAVQQHNSQQLYSLYGDDEYDYEDDDEEYEGLYSYANQLQSNNSNTISQEGEEEDREEDEEGEDGKEDEEIEEENSTEQNSQSNTNSQFLNLINSQLNLDNQNSSQQQSNSQNSQTIDQNLEFSQDEEISQSNNSNNNNSQN